MLHRCDAIFLIPGWENSKGAKMEKEFALQNGIPVFYDIGILRDWLGQNQ